MVKGFNPETGELVEIKKVSNDLESLEEAFGEPEVCADIAR
jgi:hypothetical protein